LRIPGTPDVRIAALATALVMAVVAIPKPGIVTTVPEAPSIPAAPTTATDGSTGSLEAISLGVLADVRWRAVKPFRAPTPPDPVEVAQPGCASVAATLASEGAESVSRAERATLMSNAATRSVALTLDTDCLDAGARLSWYINAEEIAEADRAERAEVRRLKRIEARRQERQAKRAAERRAAARAAERRAELRRAAARRAAAHRAAERRAAARRAAARRAAARQGSGTSGGWRNAPIVTWYGPGFYGNRTACGVPYTRTIVGVAHKTLPCGTLVRFKWHGITAVAPVIDRGPYASAAHVFDFSAALSCKVFKPRGVKNACFTRYDVKYQVVGRVNLKRYLATH
jgi:rare lipoprotein A (peptidoglycan hydrolase)